MTGVQTCALPISACTPKVSAASRKIARSLGVNTAEDEGSIGTAEAEAIAHDDVKDLSRTQILGLQQVALRLQTDTIKRKLSGQFATILNRDLEAVCL